MKYTSTNEIMQALFAGKKLKCDAWAPYEYINWSTSQFAIVDQNNETCNLQFLICEDWINKSFWDSFDVGDKFSYQFNDGSSKTYKILFINAEACFCKDDKNPLNFCAFLNELSSNNKMSRI